MNEILVVDDEQDIRELISDILEDEGYTTSLAGTANEALSQLENETPALMILDIWLRESHMDGIDILKHAKREYPDIPVVIISGHGNIEIAVAAIKQGAYDFIEKPFNIDQLMVVIRRAMETSRLRRENVQLKRDDRASSEMIGESPAFKTLLARLDKVTTSNARVLLSGPPGAGKEIAARYIHKNSTRSEGPFVSVSSASIAPEAMEDVLFGRESEDRGIEAGLLERADGGILFLDEVSEMPLGTQSKILRVLVEQQFRRVGGQDPIKVDLRVLSSTTKNLESEIEAGKFRRELFDRLNVVPILVPNLQSRPDDIPLLANHFIKICNQQQGLPLRKITDEAVSAMQAMSWPGNVRQLKNLIERVLIMGETQAAISAEELGSDAEGDREKGGSAATLPVLWAALPLREAREAFEREYLSAQISRFAGNVSRTANFVGMERSALHRKLKSLNLSGDIGRMESD